MTPIKTSLNPVRGHSSSKPGILIFRQMIMSFECESGYFFPTKGQPGYEEAISFCETNLLSTSPLIEVVRTFDENNLKVVKLRLQAGGKDFTTESIGNGIGWHNERKPGGLVSILA